MKENLVILINEDKIERKLGELAETISADYRGKTPVLIGILSGAFIFMADLARRLTIPIRFEFLKVSSYGKRATSSQKVRIVSLINEKIEGEDLLIVEDIVDTGFTTSRLLSFLRKKKPHSIKICSFLDKRARRKQPVKIDYVGFEVPNKFLVGYGLDYQERYRSLPYIAYLKQIKK